MGRGTSCSMNLGSNHRYMHPAGELKPQFWSTLFSSSRLLATWISMFGKTDQLLSSSTAKNAERG